MRQLLTYLFLFISSFASSQSKNLFAKIGTTGIGIGYEKTLNTKFSLGSSIQVMNLKPTVFFKGSDYQHRARLNLKFIQLELAGKWYPKAKTTTYGSITNNSFFIKAGVLLRDNASYRLTSDYQKVTGNNQFDNSNPKIGQLIIELKTNLIQPFFALGFELTPTDNRWSASIEGGLSYHGTPPTVPFVNFYETGAIKIYEPNFARWVRVPQIIRIIKAYPLLNLTVGRRF